MPGKGQGLSGWTRGSPPFHEYFWIQINPYGFDRHWGGEFVVEFVCSNRDRKTALRDRTWRLLDDESRSEAIRLSNDAIKALPELTREMLRELPETLRELYRDKFEPMAVVPALDHDVWFRYATLHDVEAWGDFLASRLARVIGTIEQRLGAIPEGAAILFGSMHKTGEELWTDVGL